MVDFLTKSGSNSSIELKIVLVILGILALGILTSGGAGLASAQEVENNTTVTTDDNATYEWIFYTQGADSYSDDSLSAVNPDGEVLNIPTDVDVENMEGITVDDHGRLFVISSSLVEVYNINENSLEEVHQFKANGFVDGPVHITKTDFYWAHMSSSTENYDEVMKYDLESGKQTKIWSWGNFSGNSKYEYDSMSHFAGISSTDSGDPLIGIDTIGGKAIINTSDGKYGTAVAEWDEAVSGPELYFSENYYYTLGNSPTRVSIYTKSTHNLQSQSSHSHTTGNYKFGIRDSDGAYFHGIEYTNENASQLYRFDDNESTLVTNYDGDFGLWTRDISTINTDDITVFEGGEYVSVERLAFSDGSRTEIKLVPNTSEKYYIKGVAYSTDSVPLDYGSSSGQLEVVSIEGESNDPINNTTVSVYNSSDTLVWEQTAEDAYLAPFSLEAGDYTVVANASGFSATSQNITVKRGETASVSFTLSEQATPTETENEVIIGGGDDDDTLGVLVPIGIGGTGFLFFVLLVVFGFKRGQRQRQFALLLAMLVLSSTLAPMVFVGGFSGTVQAQSTTGDANQAADLIIYTLGSASGHDTIYAVDPTSGELAWRTEVTAENTPTVTAVANNPDSDEVYALAHGNTSKNPIQIAVLNKSSGEVKKTVDTGVTADVYSTRTRVANNTYYFSADDSTYAYDSESGEVSESYQYETSLTEAKSTDMDVSVSGDLHQLNIYDGEYTTYENGNISSTGSQSIDVGYYTDDGWVAQYNSDGKKISILNKSWERGLGLSTNIYDAASGPTYTYLHYGTEVYQYNASTGDREFAYTTAHLDDSEYVDGTYMDYDPDDQHLHEVTSVGIQSDGEAEPRLEYTVRNTTAFADDGATAYSKRIPTDGFLNESVANPSTSSMTIVYDDADSNQSVVIGGGEDSDDGSLEEMILDWVLNWIENNLGIVIVGVFGILLVLGMIVFALTRIWSVAKIPLSVLLLPFRLVWKGLKKLVSWVF